MRFVVLIVAFSCSACDIVFPLEFFDPIPHIPDGLEQAGTADVILDADTPYVVDTSSDEPARSGFGDAPFEVIRQEGGDTDVLVVRVASFRVDGILQLVGTRPFVVIAQTIEVKGTIDASADGVRAGPGGGRPDAADPGEGGPGDKILSFRDNHSGGGGGGFAVGAGGGGDVDCFSRDVDGGRPGLEVGERFLKVLQGGGAGGRGAFECTAEQSIGGAGGGALQLSALDTITIEGFVLAGGGGGQGGRAGGACISMEGAGSGGGAGGAIYIDAPIISNTGTIAANGGGGGGGGDSGGAGAGDNGKNASDPDMPSTGGPASGEGTFGGEGATTGVAGSGLLGRCINVTDRFNTGGGGGAPGRIVFRGETAMVGTVSPTQEEPPRRR